MNYTKTVMASLLVFASWHATAAESMPMPMPGAPGASRVAEPAAFTAVQQRLNQLATQPEACPATYHRFKSQAWLNVARDKWHDSGEPAAVNESLAQATSLVDRLEQGSNPAWDTPALRAATQVRADLWQQAEALRSSTRLCASADVQRLTAFCEVQLAWSGYETTRGGWKHTAPYIRIAEDLCAEAQRAPAPPVPEPPPAPQVVQKPLVSEKVVLNAQALFRHDRSALADMLPAGLRAINVLAQELRAKAGLEHVVVSGHADSTGTPGYNHRLALARADTVRNLLVMRGVDASKMDVRSLGDTQPVVTQCQRAGGAAGWLAYTACLQPNRRVEIEWQGTP
ncbi:OmpA family protein [Rhodoferax sp.]|uniref:OmpA family protein n=1 Tax=Rhodoferax sp. TaxID=50421 RepID=UPI0025F4C223|nr:OmpA family protein [Rhodoferax sp.]